MQAGVFTYLLWLLSSNVESYFSTQQLPSQFTPRNITITIRTVVQGMAYLATFIFGANTLGLTGEVLADVPRKRSGVPHCCRLP